MAARAKTTAKKKPKRKTSVGGADYDAKCRDCSWKQHAPNALGLAALHHDKNDHAVDIVKTQTISYG